jgi:hypothetical protein
MEQKQDFPFLIFCAVLFTLLCGWTGLNAYVPPQRLRDAFETVLNAGVIVAVVTGVVAVLAVLIGLMWLAWVGVSHGLVWWNRVRLTRAEADKADREANLVITIAPPGSQVYAHEVNGIGARHKPIYLAPGDVNGKVIEYTAEESRRWAFFNLTQNIGKKPELATEELPQLQLQTPLPEHVDLSHYLMGTCTLHNIFLGMGRFPDGQVRPVSAPLDRLVHIAEAGSSGFGKSTHLLALAYQCINAREAPRVVMLDPQAVTFTPFAGDERLLYPLASKEADILAILVELAGEMERRQQLFAQWRGVANLGQYNRVAAEGERLPQVQIFFDEFGLVAKNKAIARQVKMLSQGGRKAGISLIAGSQTWGADDIATSLRANLSTSIQFYARDKSTSRVLIGDSAAANITRPGQAFCRLPGTTGLIELQAPDPSNLLDLTPVLLQHNGAMPVMPKSKEDEFVQLVQDGMTKSAACWQVYERDFSGTFAQKLNRLLSSNDDHLN